MAGALDALYTGAPGEAQQILNNFWPRVLDEIKNVKIVSVAVLCLLMYQLLLYGYCTAVR